MALYPYSENFSATKNNELLTHTKAAQVNLKIIMLGENKTDKYILSDSYYIKFQKI